MKITSLPKKRTISLGLRIKRASKRHMLPAGEYVLPDEPIERVVVKSKRGMPLIVLTALFTIFDTYMLTNLNPKNPRQLIDPRLVLEYEDSHPVADGIYNPNSITISLYRNAKRGKKTYGDSYLKLWNDALNKKGEKRKIGTSWDGDFPYLHILLHELGHHLDFSIHLSKQEYKCLIEAWKIGVQDYYDSLITENQGERKGIPREILLQDRDEVILNPEQVFPLTKNNRRANSQYYASFLEQVAELHALYCYDQRLKKEVHSMAFRGLNFEYGGIQKEATEYAEPLYRALKQIVFENPKVLKKLEAAQRKINRQVKEKVAASRKAKQS